MLRRVNLQGLSFGCPNLRPQDVYGMLLGLRVQGLGFGDLENGLSGWPV